MEIKRNIGAKLNLYQTRPSKVLILFAMRVMQIAYLKVNDEYFIEDLFTLFNGINAQ